MDFTIKPKTGIPKLASEEYQEVYELIKQYGNADLAFKNQTNSKYYNKHFVMVDKEADRIIEEIKCKLSDCFKISEAEYDDEGNMIKEAEYFKATTETALKDSLSSDMLNVEEVYNDFKGDKTWTELKSEYQNEVE